MLTLIMFIGCFSVINPVIAGAIETSAWTTPFAYEKDGYIIIADNDELTDDEFYEYSFGNSNLWNSCSKEFYVICTSDTILNIRRSDSDNNHSNIYSMEINKTIGSYSASFKDITLGDNALLFDFTRTYNSSDGWFFSFESSINEMASYPGVYDLLTTSGNHEYFIYDDDRNIYMSQSGYELELNRNTNNEITAYTVNYDKDTTAQFDNSGRLTQLTQSGYSNVFSYSGSSITITGADSAIYTVILNQNMQPVSITTPVYTYTDKNGNTVNQNRNVSYTWQGNNLISFTDAGNVTHNYTYSSTDLLTAYDGVQLAYTIDGRIARELYSDGSFTKYKYNDLFTNDNNYNGQLTIYNSTGQTETMDYPSVLSYENDDITYDTDNISAVVPESTISALAYIVNIEYETTDENDDNDLYPIYEEGVGGSWFYTYSEPDTDGNREITEQLYIPKENITSSTDIDNITHTIAENLATEKYTYSKTEYRNGNTGYTDNYYEKENGTFVLKNRNVNTYNAKGEIVSCVKASHHDILGPGCYNDEEHTYRYDSCGRLNYEYIIKAYDVLDIINEYRYTYNTFGELTGTTGHQEYFAIFNSNASTIYDCYGRVISAHKTAQSDYSGYSGSTMYIGCLNSSETTDTEYIYSGELLTSEITDGAVTSYTYSNNLLTQITDPSGNTINYTYDNFGNLMTKSAMDYTMYYDTMGNLTEFSKGNVQLSSYNYDGNNLLTGTDYSNGHSVDYTYDSEGKLTSIISGGNVLYSYAYAEDNDGEIITTITDNVAAVKTVYAGESKTVYDISDEETELYSVTDTDSGRTESFGTDEYTINHINKADIYGRTNGEDYTYKLYSGDEMLYFSHEEVEGVYVTDIEKDTFDQNVSTLLRYNNGGLKKYTIVYDVSGKIVRYNITENQAITATGSSVEYEYDSLDRLVRVNDPYEQETTIYTYDENNNITGKSVYSYTTGSTNNLTAVHTDSYTYSSRNSDKLISFNGSSVTYDSTGNPVSYLGHTLSWTQGRLLESYDTICYTYNENGIRTSKTSGGTMTRYFLDGTTVIGQTDGTNELHYRYSESGILVGLVWNGTDYFYIRNLLGDIVAILDSDGNIVCEYTYDAWGNVLSVVGTNTALANLNPFRYRGYFYDTDTGFYYLQNRYYDPVTGRFINCDTPEYIGIDGTYISWNGYAYCNNDPMNHTDSQGKSVSALTVSLVAIATTAICSAILISLLAKEISELIINLSSTVIKKVINNNSEIKNFVSTKFRQFILTVDSQLAIVLSMIISEAVKNAKQNKKKAEDHHIVARCSSLAHNSRELIKKYDIEVEDQVNKIKLKYGVHRVLHTAIYHSTVYHFLCALERGEKREEIQYRLQSGLLLIKIILIGTGAAVC